MSKLLKQMYAILRIDRDGRTSIQMIRPLDNYAELAKELIELSQSIEATYYMIKIEKVV